MVVKARPCGPFMGLLGMPRDLTTAISLVREGLPRSSRWSILGTHMDWTFAGSWQRTDSEIFGLDDSALVALRPFLVFGGYTFDGGASPMVGLHETDGTVHGIDVDRGADPVFWFNNSLAAFVETFGLLDSALRSPGGSVPSGLRDNVARIDPVCFERSDWAGLLHAVIK